MTDIDALTAHIRRTLGDLGKVSPDGEYDYSSLALCVIDAVYSLGVRYESTERTVAEWCRRYGWVTWRKDSAAERTISDFLHVLQPYEGSWDQMADVVFRNRQRTAPRSGILKAEAVYRFAKTLQNFGVESRPDAVKTGLRADIRRALTAIPGQTSGLSYNYFLILAGNTDGVKADRMVTRFVADALGVRTVAQETCEQLVREAAVVLRSEFPKLTPSLLDNRIWEYQRGLDNGNAKGRCRPG